MCQKDPSSEDPSSEDLSSKSENPVAVRNFKRDWPEFTSHKEEHKGPSLDKLPGSGK